MEHVQQWHEFESPEEHDDVHITVAGYSKFMREAGRVAADLEEQIAAVKAKLSVRAKRTS